MSFGKIVINGIFSYYIYVMLKIVSIAHYRGLIQHHSGQTIEQSEFLRKQRFKTTAWTILIHWLLLQAIQQTSSDILKHPTQNVWRKQNLSKLKPSAQWAICLVPYLSIPRTLFPNESLTSILNVWRNSSLTYSCQSILFLRLRLRALWQDSTFVTPYLVPRHWLIV